MNLKHILSHCAFCDKALKECEGINGGIIYPFVWCNEECRKNWEIKRRMQACSRM